MRPTAGFLRVADRPACPRRGPRGVGHAAPGLPGRGSRAPGRVLGASEGLGAGLGSRAPRRTPRRRAVAGRRRPTRKWRRPVSGVRPPPSGGTAPAWRRSSPRPRACARRSEERGAGGLPTLGYRRGDRRAAPPGGVPWLPEEGARGRGSRGKAGSRMIPAVRGAALWVHEAGEVLGGIGRGGEACGQVLRGC